MSIKKVYTYRFIMLALCAILITHHAYSQHDPQFSMNRFNLMGTNPGFAGSQEKIHVNLIDRHQWYGFENAPNEQAVNLSAPFNLFGRSHGFGLSIMRDAYAFNQDISGSLSYAYKINTDDGLIGIGVKGGVYNTSLDAEWDPSDGGSADSDPLIPKADDSNYALDLGFGLFYQKENLYVGLAGNHLNTPTITGTAEVSQLAPNFYLAARYFIGLNNPAFQLSPGIHMHTDGRLTQLDLNTYVIYNDKVWGGLSYRFGEAIVGMVGAELFKDVNLGLAYDFTLSDIGSYTQAHGGFEIVLNYVFSLQVEKEPSEYKSIRFL